MKTNILSIPIADLHCDLLCYLAHNSTRTPHDLAVRCSIPQLQEGNVKIQTMAIFAETEPDSSKKGVKQAEIFLSLCRQFPGIFKRYQPDDDPVNTAQIALLPSIENASSFCAEGEDLEKSLTELDVWQRKMGKFLYMSLTWNTENRFGGGSHTNIGLKCDGQRVLQYLSRRNIALDISHASDRLAEEALNYIDKEKLNLSVIASHSNLRSVHEASRNLPDDLAKEIVKRNGIIGLNFVRFFVGPDNPKNFIRQMEHAIKLGCQDALCFGADFFYGNDVSPAYRKTSEELFFPHFDHAGTYWKVLELWRSAGNVSEEVISGICYGNFQRFLKGR